MIKFCLLVLASMAAYTYAAVGLYPPEPKPAEFAHLSGCYLKVLNLVLPYDKPYYPKGKKECLQYTCGKDNVTQVFSCGLVQLPPNCRMEYDYTLDYPKCCGSPVCDPTTTTEVPCVTVTTEPPWDYPTDEPTTEQPSSEPPCNHPTDEPTTEQPSSEPPCHHPRYKPTTKPPRSEPPCHPTDKLTTKQPTRKPHCN